MIVYSNTFRSYLSILFRRLLLGNQLLREFIVRHFLTVQKKRLGIFPRPPVNCVYLFYFACPFFSSYLTDVTSLCPGNMGFLCRVYLYTCPMFTRTKSLDLEIRINKITQHIYTGLQMERCVNFHAFSWKLRRNVL